jgi:GTP-binding protein
LINFFGLRSGGRLADLPGYGYAKVPAEIQRHWQELLSRYVENRASLRGLVIVMDARRPLTDFDWQMLHWVRDRPLRTHLLLTKADKLNWGEATQTLKQVMAQTSAIASAQLFSATSKTGVEDARAWVLSALRATSGPKKEPR